MLFYFVEVPKPKAGVISRNHPYIQAAVEAIIARAWAVGDAKTGDLG